MAKVMLTTYNNPYNPFTDFVKWNIFDSVDLGLSSVSLLGRIARLSNSFTEEEENAECERAIDEIVEMFPSIYVKVKESDFVMQNDSWKMLKKPPTPGKS